MVTNNLTAVIEVTLINVTFKRGFAVILIFVYGYHTVNMTNIAQQLCFINSFCQHYPFICTYNSSQIGYHTMKWSDMINLEVIRYDEFFKWSDMINLEVITYDHLMQFICNVHESLYYARKFVLCMKVFPVQYLERLGSFGIIDMCYASQLLQFGLFWW